MSKLISVIVLVYNSAFYLKKSIGSICGQSYKNLEIIIVNDGSYDASREICEDFQKKDSRIRVFNQENRGISAARNFAISKASGEYLCFVDSDDWIPPGAIETLFQSAMKHSSDFCYGETKRIGTLREGNARNVKTLDFDKQSSAMMVSYLNNMLPGPWAKLYKTDIINRMNEPFPLGVGYGEDMIFLYRYLQQCSRFSCVSDVVYYYNVMNQHASSRKQYADMGTWLLKQIVELKTLLEHNTDDPARQYLGQQLYKVFHMSAVHYMRNFSYDAGAGLFNKTKEEYCNYIYHNALETVCDSDGLLIIDKIRNQEYEAQITNHKSRIRTGLTYFAAYVKQWLLFKVIR